MDRTFISFLLLITLSACAIPVKQEKLSYPLQPSSKTEFRLEKDAKTSIGTGYHQELRAGTRWIEVGTIEKGIVFRSPDQILAVEGFDIHEAYPVLTNMHLIGFYLPVEKTFVPASNEVTLNVNQNN